MMVGRIFTKIYIFILGFFRKPEKLGSHTRSEWWPCDPDVKDDPNDPVPCLVYITLNPRSFAEPWWVTLDSVRENVCNYSKNAKSHHFGFWKTQKRTHSFRGHLITPDFNTQLPKISTGELPTSDILLYNNVSVITQLTTFYDLLTSHLKNVKSHVFWNLKKNVKYVFSKTDFGDTLFSHCLILFLTNVCKVKTWCHPQNW